MAEMQRATPGAALGSLGSPIKAALAATAPPAAAAPPLEEPGGGGADLPLLLSAAAVALLQAQPALAEHAVALGYVEKLLRLLAARVPALPAGGLTAELLDSEPLLPGGRAWEWQHAAGVERPAGRGDARHGALTGCPLLRPSRPSAPTDELSGSLLRLLHQLASSISAAEALARCTPAATPLLLGALRWGTGAAGARGAGGRCEGRSCCAGGRCTPRLCASLPRLSRHAAAPFVTPPDRRSAVPGNAEASAVPVQPLA